MARGLLKGVLWGAGVSAGVVALVSIVDNESGTQATADATRTSSLAETASQRTAPTSDTGLAAIGLSAQEGMAPEPDTLSGLLTDTLASVAVPQTGSVADLDPTRVPEGTALSGILQPKAQASKVNHNKLGGLETPATEQELSISTDPAQPLAPNADTQTTAFETPGDVLSENAGDLDAAEVTETPDLDLAKDNATPNLLGGSQETFAGVADPVQPTLPDDSSSKSLSNPNQVTVNDREEPDEIEKVVTAFIQQAAEIEAKAPKVGAVPAKVITANDVQPSTPQAKDRLETDSLTIELPVQPMARTSEDDILATVTPEAVAPAQSPFVDLMDPGSIEQVAAEGESASARVAAKLDIETPKVLAPAPEPTPAVANIEPGPVPRQARQLARAPAGDAQVDKAVTEVAAPSILKTDDDEVRADAEPVRVNQLPSLGSVTTSDLEPDSVVDVVATEYDAAPDRPVDRFAVTFENPEAKPLIAVVLMDDGVDLNAPIYGLEALQDLPYPVSFAVDALLPDAAERMQAYRSAGFEVLATVDLPEGASATDADVNLAIVLVTLPEIVGVLEGVRTGVQTTPGAGRQVAHILAKTGHGFVTQNRGLNTVQKLAERDGVPSAVVFRDFDSKGQTATVIRRFFDQAAFRAVQEDAVVMLGRLREETISGLLLWSLQDRASTIALSPVTSVLRVP